MSKKFMSVGLLMFAMSLGLSAASVVTPKNIETVTIVQQAGACTGVVVDANGEPLVGASVLVKGTTKGAMVDNDGRFSIAGVKAGEVPASPISAMRAKKSSGTVSPSA